jgi:hypothetical protein
MMTPDCNCHRKYSNYGGPVTLFGYVDIGMETILGGLDSMPVFLEVKFCPQCGKPYVQ